MTVIKIARKKNCWDDGGRSDIVMMMVMMYRKFNSTKINRYMCIMPILMLTITVYVYGIH